MPPKKSPAMRRTGAPVEEFLARIPGEQRREDARRLCAMMAAVTGELPAMWGTSIIGFGTCHYRYPSGHEGDSPLASFSPRSQHLAIYLIGGFEARHRSALARLGPHKTGKGCLYIKRLGEVNEGALRELIDRSARVRKGADLTSSEPHDPAAARTSRIPSPVPSRSPGPGNKELSEMSSGAGPVWVETEVIEVCRPDRPEEPYLRPHVVVLRERGGTRRLPMFTGSAEAIALASSLGAGDLPRPRAYQLAADLLAAAGSRLTEVRITTLADGVFHAAAVVAGPDGTAEVGARPSDVVNLAVLAGVPIRVDAAILDDPVVDSHPEWEEYPARLADLVAEERQRRADFQARLAQAQQE